jgi:ABC-type polysaccharide/polyol phosphate transport system ATPase subunit
LCSPSYWRGDPAEAGDIVVDTNTAADVEPVVEGIANKLALEIKGLCKVFYSNGIRKVAVSHLNLDVYRGQITALLGHNGAGKVYALPAVVVW